MLSHALASLRRIAIALPARDEECDFPDCPAALDVAAARYDGAVTCVALATDCTDATLAAAQAAKPRHLRIELLVVALLPGARRAGWARRFAFDAALATLCDESDILTCTDADTLVAPVWIERTLAHIDGGADVVAGLAVTRRVDRAALGRYYTPLGWLDVDLAPHGHDPWLRHFYERGASAAEPRDVPPHRRCADAADRRRSRAVRSGLRSRRHNAPPDRRAPGGMADAFAR